MLKRGKVQALIVLDAALSKIVQKTFCFIFNMSLHLHKVPYLWPIRGVDDAISTLINMILTHLDGAETFV